MKKKQLLVAIECFDPQFAEITGKSLSLELKRSLKFSNELRSLHIDTILERCGSSKKEHLERTDEDLFRQILVSTLKDISDLKNDSETKVIICPNYIDYIKLNSDYFNQKIKTSVEDFIIRHIKDANLFPDFTFVIDLSPNIKYLASYERNSEIEHVILNKNITDFFVENKKIQMDFITYIEIIIKRNKEYLDYFKNPGKNCFILKNRETSFDYAIPNIIINFLLRELIY